MEPGHKLIKFIPGVEFTDPSYHLPHFYELFALWADEEDRMFWREAAGNSRGILHFGLQSGHRTLTGICGIRRHPPHRYGSSVWTS